MELNAKIPPGPLKDKWDFYKDHAKLVNPANRKKLSIIVVGTGLAGSSVAASMAEMGYNVKSFCFQDSARRAHSVAAQGGVNAAKNYKNDGDSVYRMFYDTLKGGDFRSREANVYRLAECSAQLIDQAVAQGVPFGREYGGYLNNRSFGGVQVSRTFYARGQTGQQLLLGAYQALMRQDRPVEFDHDCREGICGQCGMMINGRAHGPVEHITTCQLHMREFNDGDTIYIEPFRAKAFPVKRDLKVDRSAFDRIIMAGGFISVNTGQAPEANSIPITFEEVESAFDSAACIGCGACVATCKNASAALFTAAKISHLAQLPQGKMESRKRALSMVARMDEEQFGSCSNTAACEVECPQRISVLNIARMNREYVLGSLFKK